MQETIPPLLETMWSHVYMFAYFEVAQEHPTATTIFAVSFILFAAISYKRFAGRKKVVKNKQKKSFKINFKVDYTTEESNKELK